jgi:hypothetical protein
MMQVRQIPLKVQGIHLKNVQYLSYQYQSLKQKKSELKNFIIIRTKANQICGVVLYNFIFLKS